MKSQAETDDPKERNRIPKAVEPSSFSRKELIDRAAEEQFPFTLKKEPEFNKMQDHRREIYRRGADFALTICDDKEKRNGVVQECIDSVNQWTELFARFSDESVKPEIIEELEKLKKS